MYDLYIQSSDQSGLYRQVYSVASAHNKPFTLSVARYQACLQACTMLWHINSGALHSVVYVKVTHMGMHAIASLYTVGWHKV